MSDLPLWKCHKEVRAARITGLGPLGSDGYAELFLEDAHSVMVTAEWLARKAPTEGDPVGGYYVVYPPDNYASWSPAAPFESGYARI